MMSTAVTSVDDYWEHDYVGESICGPGNACDSSKIATSASDEGFVRTRMRLLHRSPDTSYGCVNIEE